MNAATYDNELPLEEIARCMERGLKRLLEMTPTPHAPAEGKMKVKPSRGAKKKTGNRVNGPRSPSGTTKAR
jgi:hypothetical protein